MGRAVIAALLISVCVGLFAQPALAYKAEAGMRAANFKGFDIVSRQTVELDDYIGQWVLVDFWATWCGPCMEELPHLVEQTRPFVDSGRLRVITVSCDVGFDRMLPTREGEVLAASTLPELRKVLRETGLSYPVIYDGGAYSESLGWPMPIPATEWGIDGLPNCFLINPQGVIVAEELRGDELGREIAAHMAGERPLISLSSSYVENADGTLSVFAEVINPTHEPLTLRLSSTWEDWKTDESDAERRPLIIERGHSEEPALQEIRFTEFDYAVHEFRLSPPAEADTFGYWLSIRLPGTEQEDDGNGLWLSDGESQAILPGIVWTDEGWRLREPD